jgi:hypothetical protein
MAKPRYWAVGAAWGGKEHHDAEWVKLGIWILGWDEGPQYEKAQQIRPGDRIAIKRIRGKGKGKGSEGIKVMHLGIVKGQIADCDRPTFTVDWVATNLDRDVVDSTFLASIHGPFDYEDDGIPKIFCL